MTPMRLSSLIVQAQPMRSPRWAAARETKRAKTSAASVGLPPPPIGEPGRGREVVECHDRGDAPLAAGRTDAAVVVERSEGELALGRLDAAPLEGESIGLEAHVRHELDVFGPAVQ